MKKSVKRVLALAAAVLLAGLYVLTLVFALMKNEAAAALFRGALAATVILPVLLYAFLLIARTVKPRKSPVIDTIILDVGNVLIQFGWREYAAGLGLTEKDVKDLQQKVMNTELWVELDTNKRPTEEVAEELAALMPEKADLVRSIILDLDRTLTPFPYASDWIRGMKSAGYRVLFLSNWSVRAYERMKKRGALDFEELTDGGIWSFDVHLAKPDPAIYSLLLQRYELDPGRCLFIDDHEENLVPARRMGIAAVRFRDYADIRTQLEGLGIRW